jgi:hypothetical protein
MLVTLEELEPILVIGFGIAAVGSILGILWYRSAAPSNFNSRSVLFIVKIFSAIGAGTIILGILMKQ